MTVKAEVKEVKVKEVGQQQPDQWKGFKIHPAADKFPLITGKEFDELKKDIKLNGQIEPIEMHERQVIDGRNRLKACLDLGIEPKTEEWTGNGSIIQYIISKNIHRRHLNESQRAMMAAALLPILKEEGKRNKPLAGEQNDANLQPKRTNQIAGEMLNVSARSVADASKVESQGTEELKQVVTSGEMAVSTAAIIAELPKEEQKEVLEKGTKEAVKVAKTVKETKKIPADGEPKGDMLTTVKRQIAITLDDIDILVKKTNDAEKLKAMLQSLKELKKGIDQAIAS